MRWRDVLRVAGWDSTKTNAAPPGPCLATTQQLPADAACPCCKCGIQFVDCLAAKCTVRTGLAKPDLETGTGTWPTLITFTVVSVKDSCLSVAVSLYSCVAEKLGRCVCMLLGRCVCMLLCRWEAWSLCLYVAVSLRSLVAVPLCLCCCVAEKLGRCVCMLLCRWEAWSLCRCVYVAVSLRSLVAVSLSSFVTLSLCRCRQQW
jgi:hypothetical protein